MLAVLSGIELGGVGVDVVAVAKFKRETFSKVGS